MEYGNRLIIERHHQLRPYEGIYKQTVEAFRLADLADLTRGYVRKKLPFAAVSQAVAVFPYLGFHQLLLKWTFRQFLQNPFNPLPMLRWRK
ncbi:hypothetical protein BH09BAC1_BH09BAC1_13180 [soil metagenome]